MDNWGRAIVQRMQTCNRILEVAEQLFSQQGLAQTSLRAITTEAGVNLASVHYHFGSKEALVRSIFERRLKPMNAERLRRLDELEKKYLSRAVLPLQDLLEAFIAPPLELSRDVTHGGQHFIRLLGRTYTEPDPALSNYIRTLYKGTIERFRNAFARSLPELPPEELYWRLHFIVGTLAYCMTGSETMRLIASSHVACGDASDTKLLIRRLLAFLEGGLGASASHEGTFASRKANAIF